MSALHLLQNEMLLKTKNRDCKKIKNQKIRKNTKRQHSISLQPAVPTAQPNQDAAQATFQKLLDAFQDMKQYAALQP